MLELPCVSWGMSLATSVPLAVGSAGSLSCSHRVSKAG